MINSLLKTNIRINKQGGPNFQKVKSGVCSCKGSGKVGSKGNKGGEDVGQDRKHCLGKLVEAVGKGSGLSRSPYEKSNTLMLILYKSVK